MQKHARHDQLGPKWLDLVIKGQNTSSSRTSASLLCVQIAALLFKSSRVKLLQHKTCLIRTLLVETRYFFEFLFFSVSHINDFVQILADMRS